MNRFLIAIIIATIFSSPAFSQRSHMQRVKLLSGDSITINMGEVRTATTLPSGGAKLIKGSPSQAQIYETASTFSSVVSASCGNLVSLIKWDNGSTQQIAVNPQWIDRITPIAGVQRTLIIFRENSQPWTVLGQFQTVSALLSNCSGAGGGGGDNWGTQSVTITGSTLTGNGTSGSPLRVATNGITSSEIAAGTILMSDIAQNGASSGQVIKWNGLAWAPAADNTGGGGGGGDNWGTQTVTITGSTLSGNGTSGSPLQVAANGITSANIANGTIVAADLNQMSATTGQALKWNGVAWTPANVIDGTSIFTGSGLTGTGVSGNPLDWAGGFASAPLTGSGTSLVPFTVASNSINASHIATGGVATAEILDGTILMSDIGQNGAATGEVIKWNGSAWAPAADNTGGGGGSTNLTYTGVSSPVTLNSDTGSDVNIASGGINSISVSGSTMTITATEVDGSVTNELQTLSVSAGTTTLSNSGGSMTIAGAGINAVSTVGSTITVTGTEVDGSLTNEGSLTVGAGTGTTSVISSNTSGSTPVTLTVGTGLSSSEVGNVITMTNTAPDQTVSITNGGGVSVSGTYPSFTLTATDQSTTNEVVTISDGTNSEAMGGQTLTVTGSGGAVVSYSPGTNTLTINAGSSSGGDNWGSQVVIHGSTLTGNGVTGNILDVATDGITATQIAAGAVGTSEIADGSVALSDMANMATSSLIYRKTAGSGAPEVNTLATLKTDLGLTGTNSGDQTITLTGDVTGSGTGSFTTTIADNSVDGTDIAFGSDALGDMPYYNGTDFVRLAGNTTATKQFLSQTGTGAVSAAPVWSALSASDIPSASGGDVTGPLTNLQIASGVVGTTEVTDNSLTAGDLSVNVVSSVEGVDNDGGNIDLIGAGILAITSDNTANTITLTATEVDGSTTNEPLTISDGTNSETLAGQTLTVTGAGGATVSYAPVSNTLTITASGGGGGDNWGTQVVVHGSTMTGNGVTGTALDVATDGITANEIATGAVGTSEIADGSVGLTDLANMATGSLYYRKTAGAGPPEVNTLSTLKSDLGLTGTNSGDQTITLTGDVTGSGTGSFTTTIADNSVDGTDIAFGSDALGDVPYYNGTDFTRLAGNTTTTKQFLSQTGNGSVSAAPSWSAIGVSDIPAASGGDVTGLLNNLQIGASTVGTNEITNGTVANADLANMAATTIKGNDSGVPNVAADLTVAQVKTMLNLTGTNSGDQTITLTGDVTGSGTGSFSATIADNSVDGTDIALGSDAQGDIMFYNGTDWVRLAAGTSGQFLQTQGAAANPLWATGGGGADNWGTQVVVHGSTLTGNGVTGNILDVATDGITATQIAAGAVGTSEIADGSVALSDMANMATSSLIYRKTAGSGAPEVNTLATLKTDLGLTGTNSGDQTITLTGDITGSGTGSFATTISANSVTGADIAFGSDLLGDMPYYNGTDFVRLPGNTTATKQFLSQTGTGAVSAAPSWSALSASDIPSASGGDVTGPLTNLQIASSTVGSTEITDGSVALSDMANMATGSLIYRKTAGTGVPEVNTLTTLKTDLGLTGTNSGDQTITLTGDVTGSGTGSFTATISANSVTGADIALGSDAQGDIMFYNGTDWARLPAGTSGQFLQTQGAAANPTWAAAGGGSVPSGTDKQTLYYSGTTLTATSNLQNNGTEIAIGTAPVSGTKLLVDGYTLANGTVMSNGAGVPISTTAASALRLNNTTSVTGQLWNIGSMNNGQLRMHAGGLTANLFTPSGNFRQFGSIACGTADQSISEARFAAVDSTAGTVIGLIENKLVNTIAHSQLNIKAGAAGGGDASVLFTAGIRNYSFGIDNSVTNDPLVLSASSTLGTSNIIEIEATGQAIGLGGVSPSGSIVSIAAGTTSKAPLVFTSGTNKTTVQNGAVEYDGTNFYLSSGSTRYTANKVLTTTATLNFPSTGAGGVSDLTVTVTGAAVGDVVSLGAPAVLGSNGGVFFAWVSAANTVTVRFANTDNSLLFDPASGTFRVAVSKY